MGADAEDEEVNVKKSSHFIYEESNFTRGRNR